MEIHLTVPFEKIFPEIPRDIHALTGLLAQLNRTDALILCARLNRALGDPWVHDHLAKQKYAVSNFLFNEDAARINQYIRSEGRSFRDFHIFTRAGCIELIRWIAISCKDESESTPNSLQTLRTFGKAALLAGDLWQDRVLVGRLTNANGDVEAARLRSMGAMRQDVADTTYTIDPLRTMGRGRQLYKILPGFMPSFEEVFESNTGMTLEQYYQCLVVLTGFYWTGVQKEPPDWSKAWSAFEVESFCKGIPAFTRYLELEAQTADQLRQSLWSNVRDVDEAIIHFDSFNRLC